MPNTNLATKKQNDKIFTVEFIMLNNDSVFIVNLNSENPTGYEQHHLLDKFDLVYDDNKMIKEVLINEESLEVANKKHVDEYLNEDFDLFIENNPDSDYSIKKRRSLKL